MALGNIKMSVSEIYRLCIFDKDAVAHYICGAEDYLRAVYNEIVEMMGNPDGVGTTVVQVVGYCDSADRAECNFAIRSDHIASVAFIRVC